MFNVNEIRELVRMIDKSSVGELTIKTEENHEITIKKGEGTPAPVQTIVPVQEPAPSQPKVEVPAEKPAPTAVQSEEKKQEPVAADQDLHQILSPMVGIFYCAPSPEEDPFVQVGDEVSAEEIVCIVEAMKLFNEIEAEVSGEIVEVLVDNGELVEYGQPLFSVKKK